MVNQEYTRIHQLIFSNGDYKTAEVWLRNYLIKNNDYDGWFLLAWALLYQKNYSESLDLASFLVNNSSKSFKKAQYLYLLSHLYYLQNRWSDVVRFAGLALDMFKEFDNSIYLNMTDTIQHLAYAYLMLGDFVNSDRQYLRAIKMSEDQNIDNHYLYSEYADLKYRMKHYDTALLYYRKRIMSLENDKYLDNALKNELLSQSKNVSGCIFNDKGQIDEAYNAFYDAVSLDSNNCAAILNLSEIYAMKNNLDRSQYYLIKGLNKIDLKNADFWIKCLVEGKSYIFHKHNSLYRIILSFFWERGLIDKELYDANFKSTYSQLNLNKSKVKIFISYSKQDEVYKEKIYSHLAPLWQNNKIEPWNDAMISPGLLWDDIIKFELRAAHIVLFLISADFNASKYILETEIKETIERSDRGEVIAIPIYIRPCDSTDMPYSKLQGLPRDEKPVTAYENQDIALSEIAMSIREIVDKLLLDK